MFTLVEQTKDMKLYQWRSLVLNFHWNEYRVEQFGVIAQVCAKVVGEHGKMSSLVFMRGDINLALDAETRRAGAALTKEFEPYNLGQALIIEADGFRASLARSIITGVNLLARSTARQRVFREPREAVDWLFDIDDQPADVRDGKERVWVALQQQLSEEPW